MEAEKKQVSVFHGLLDVKAKSNLFGYQRTAIETK